ncbi:hypothetical protein TNCV_3501261 [Trichonephila clavipes]|nr:hypothetical protein TNCV_3501261 [Trichonephila clavipes]
MKLDHPPLRTPWRFSRRCWRTEWRDLWYCSESGFLEIICSIYSNNIPIQIEQRCLRRCPGQSSGHPGGSRNSVDNARAKITFSTFACTAR